MPSFRSPVARTLLVLALAVAFRCWRLGELPPGFSEDEAYGCRNAARFAAGQAPLELLRLYPQGTSQEVVGGHQPGLYYAWPVALFRLAGYSPVTWRLSSVLPSLAMVLALYPFGRKVLGERAAFLAALLLAVSRWHASEARWGWHVTAAWPFLAAGLLLFLAALRGNRRLPAFLSGALSAFPMSFYPSAIGFALVPLPASLLARPFRPKVLGAWLAGFVAGAVPTAYMALSQPTEFLARGRAASIFADAGPGELPLFLLGNAGQYLGLLFFRGDPLSWHTLPGTPALDTATALAFLAGLALALRRTRRPLHAALLGTLGAGFTIGVLSQTTDSPSQYRVGLAVVAVSILAAKGLLAASRLLRRRWRRPAFALAPAAVAAAALLNGVFLFSTWPSHPGYFYGNGGVYEVVAAEVERLRGMGLSVGVSSRVVSDRMRLDLALARSLDEAGRAGESSRVPYEWGRRLAPGLARIVAPEAGPAGPVADPFGRPLYAVAPPAPGAP